MRYFLIIGVLTFSFFVRAVENNSSKFGKHHAVVAFTKEDGFKLSPKAESALNIEFKALGKSNNWVLPKEALVQIKQSYGVYRKLEGWISFVLVKINNRTENSVTVSSPDLEAGDEVAITGANFLRMTDADLNSATVDNCAH